MWMWMWPCGRVHVVMWTGGSRDGESLGSGGGGSSEGEL
jgi:hypothetical protein